MGQDVSKAFAFAYVHKTIKRGKKMKQQILQEAYHFAKEKLQEETNKKINEIAEKKLKELQGKEEDFEKQKIEKIKEQDNLVAMENIQIDVPNWVLSCYKCGGNIPKERITLFRNQKPESLEIWGYGICDNCTSKIKIKYPENYKYGVVTTVFKIPFKFNRDHNLLFGDLIELIFTKINS